VALAVIVDFPGGTRDQYEAVTRELGPAGESLTVTPGAIFHAAGATEEGWRVIDVWESEEAFDRFRQQQLMPALARAGVTDRPRVQVMPVHRYLK